MIFFLGIPVEFFFRTSMWEEYQLYHQEIQLRKSAKKIAEILILNKIYLDELLGRRSFSCIVN